MNLDEARKRWPLFKITPPTEPGITGTGVWWIWYSRGSSQSLGDGAEPVFSEDLIAYADEAHESKTRDNDLMRGFPNLYIATAGNGGHRATGVWIKDRDGRDGAGTSVRFAFAKIPWEKLTDLNARAEAAVTKPDQFFWCTNCNDSKPGKREAYVFAGEYCRECCETDERVKALVKESSRSGYYE